MKHSKRLVSTNEWCLTLKGMAIVFALLSVILFFIALPIVPCSFSKETADYVNNVCIGLATGFVGMLITITYIQNALDRKEEEDERVAEYKKIIRLSKYAKLLISEYILYFNYLVTPEEKLKEIDYSSFVDHLELRDLKDIYKIPGFMNDKFTAPCVELFFMKERELFNYFLHMNAEINYKYSGNLERIINMFFEKTKEYDTRGSILGTQEYQNNGTKLSDKMCQRVAEHDRDFEKEFDEGILVSDIVIPMILFLKFLKSQKEIIKEYLIEISRIEEELNTLVKD